MLISMFAFKHKKVLTMIAAMTPEFVRELIDSEGGVLYFPNSGLFPNGLKINNVMFTILESI